MTVILETCAICEKEDATIYFKGEFCGFFEGFGFKAGSWTFYIGEDCFKKLNENRAKKIALGKLGVGST